MWLEKIRARLTRGQYAAAAAFMTGAAPAAPGRALRACCVCVLACACPCACLRARGMRLAESLQPSSPTPHNQGSPMLLSQLPMPTPYADSATILPPPESSHVLLSSAACKATS